MVAATVKILSSDFKLTPALVYVVQVQIVRSFDVTLACFNSKIFLVESI